MQKNTVFAIKANIAIILLSFLITFAAAYMFGNLLLNNVIMGMFGVITSFVSAYFATSTLLKNSHLARVEALASIKQTWRVYLVVGIVLTLFGITETLERGMMFTAFTALTFVAAYMAFALLKKQQR